MSTKGQRMTSLGDGSPRGSSVHEARSHNPWAFINDQYSQKKGSRFVLHAHHLGDTTEDQNQSVEEREVPDAEFLRRLSVYSKVSGLESVPTSVQELLTFGRVLGMNKHIVHN